MAKRTGSIQRSRSEDALLLGRQYPLCATIMQPISSACFIAVFWSPLILGAAAMHDWVRCKTSPIRNIETKADSRRSSFDTD